MQFEIASDETDVGTSLTDLQRLSRQLPSRAWPRDQPSLRSALRCLRAMDGMLCFGLVDCTAWPEDAPMPPRVLRWMLRELRVCHHGNWSRFARALEAEVPRYQVLHQMLSHLSNSFQDLQQEEPDAMERISAPWRGSSPEWWLERLPRWWAKITATPQMSRGLSWKPLHTGPRQYGKRMVRCVDSAGAVNSLLDKHQLQHLCEWVGLSLVGRVQWLLFFVPGARQPCSLAVLHATTKRGKLMVELIAKVLLWGTDDLSLDCRDAMLQLWTQRDAEGWGVLERVEREEVLAEDEDLFIMVERTRMRLWQQVARMS